MGTTTLLQSTMSTSSPPLLHHPNPNYLESQSTIFIIGYFHLHDHPSTIYNVYIISTSPSSSKSNLPIRNLPPPSSATSTSTTTLLQCLVDIVYIISSIMYTVRSPTTS